MLEWIINYIGSFMHGRCIQIAFDGYESDWFQTDTGILQGLSLSPILFLFFISELLKGMQNAKDGAFAFDFVNDTNLIM